jgi:hypothetical protein
MLNLKVEISEIFKKGENFEFKRVDYNNSKIASEIDKIRELQDDIRKMADADITAIKDVVFDL